jgi:diadenosine tetraphosphate (Ap4A) HIT family hydrolase
MSLYCFENHRTEEQLRRMRWLEAQGVCLFCPDGLEEHAGLAPIWRNEQWTIAPNDFPYKGTRLHLLLIPREHVLDMVDLSGAAREGFWEVLAHARDHYELDHYGLGVRNGRCESTGGTIRHLHMHLLVGDATLAAGTPVRMRFSSAVAR